MGSCFNRINQGIITWGIMMICLGAHPVASAAETIPALTEIRQTGQIRVGLHDDSPLFGNGEEQTGYCLDFAQVLATKLSEQWQQSITVKPIVSTTANRWQLITDGLVHLECGPNTITPERQAERGFTFSDPFFITATQILTPQSSEAKVRQGVIGVVPKTTTIGNLETWQPQPQLDQRFTTRTQGIQAALQGQISGFASDGILLIGDAFRLQLDPNRYQLITPRHNNQPFCAPYGMLLPAGESNMEWRD